MGGEAINLNPENLWKSRKSDFFRFFSMKEKENRRTQNSSGSFPSLVSALFYGSLDRKREARSTSRRPPLGQKKMASLPGIAVFPFFSFGGSIDPQRIALLTPHKHPPTLKGVLPVDVLEALSKNEKDMDSKDVRSIMKIYAKKFSGDRISS